MARVYENPPIHEAVCEFRFEPSQPWDSTVLGLVYDRVKVDFPKKKQPTGFQVEFRADPGGEVHRVAGEATRMQFLREDERALIQVGPDFISANHMKPYSDWENFKKMILQTLNAYRQVAEPKGARRIGLRYINRIEIPLEQVNIEDYLLALPTIPQPIPQLFAAWVQRVEIPFEEQIARLIIQSGSAANDGQRGATFLLDLDFITQRQEALSLDSVMEWVETAHEKVEMVFEACITEKARVLFKEVRTR